MKPEELLLYVFRQNLKHNNFSGWLVYMIYKCGVHEFFLSVSLFFQIEDILTYKKY